MLYVFHGTEIAQSVTKAQKLIDSLRQKRPDAGYVRVEAGTWHPEFIAEHAGGQGLFSNKYIVFLDRVAENSDAKETLPDLIPVMKESENIFIVLEGKANADLKKSFEKHAEKVVVSDPAEKKGGWNKDEFNIFSLADAVGNRDAFKSWNIYRQAIDQGIETESIIGTLFWQVKSMISARDASSAGEAGLSSFVYSKAKKSSSNYSGQELKSLLERLILAYHDSHRGIVNGELAIERLLLANRV